MYRASPPPPELCLHPHLSFLTMAMDEPTLHLHTHGRDPACRCHPIPLPAQQSSGDPQLRRMRKQGLPPSPGTGAQLWEFVTVVGGTGVVSKSSLVCGSKAGLMPRGTAHSRQEPKSDVPKVCPGPRFCKRPDLNAGTGQQWSRSRAAQVSGERRVPVEDTEQQKRAPANAERRDRGGRRVRELGLVQRQGQQPQRVGDPVPHPGCWIPAITYFWSSLPSSEYFTS